MFIGKGHTQIVLTHCINLSPLRTGCGSSSKSCAPAPSSLCTHAVTAQAAHVAALRPSTTQCLDPLPGPVHTHTHMKHFKFPSDTSRGAVSTCFYSVPGAVSHHNRSRAQDVPRCRHTLPLHKRLTRLPLATPPRRRRMLRSETSEWSRSPVPLRIQVRRGCARMVCASMSYLLQKM